MNYTEITKKLIGNIHPCGRSEVDSERLENMKTMCALVNDLIEEINSVHDNNKHSKEASVRAISDYADNFLTNTLRIPI